MIKSEVKSKQKSDFPNCKGVKVINSASIDRASTLTAIEEGSIGV
jgi:hypothetical protein